MACPLLRGTCARIDHKPRHQPLAGGQAFRCRCVFGCAGSVCTESCWARVLLAEYSRNPTAFCNLRVEDTSLHFPDILEGAKRPHLSEYRKAVVMLSLKCFPKTADNSIWRNFYSASLVAWGPWAADTESSTCQGGSWSLCLCRQRARAPAGSPCCSAATHSMGRQTNASDSVSNF